MAGAPSSRGMPLDSDLLPSLERTITDPLSTPAIASVLVGPHTPAENSFPAGGVDSSPPSPGIPRRLLKRRRKPTGLSHGTLSFEETSVNHIPSSLSASDLENLRLSFHFPESVNLSLPGLSDHAHHSTNNRIAVYEESLRSGLRFSLPELVIKLLKHYRIGLGQLNPNSIRMIIGFLFLCKAQSVTPSVALFRRFFALRNNGKEPNWYGFAKRPKAALLVSGIPFSHHGWKPRFFYLSSDQTAHLPSWRDPQTTIETDRPSTGYSRKDDKVLSGSEFLYLASSNPSEAELRLAELSNASVATASSFANLLTRCLSTRQTPAPEPPATGNPVGPVNIHTISDETDGTSGAELVPRKRKKPTGPSPLSLAGDKGKTPLALPEVLAEKMPPQAHLIIASKSVWGDEIPLTDLLRSLADQQESNQRLTQACKRRLLFLDQEVGRGEATADRLQEELGKLRSIEDTEKDELKRQKVLLEEKLQLNAAELESLKAEHSRQLALAKTEAVADFLSSETFKAHIQQAVDKYRRSPELGRILVELMTLVKCLGFTEAVDCLKGKMPNFDLQMIPEDQRDFYDLEVGQQVDGVIKEHEFFTAFANEAVAESPLNAETLDQ